MYLPPVDKKTSSALETEIRLLPERHQEDAIQEAWLAHLEGTDPLLAVYRYRTQEYRHEQRQPAISQLPPEEHDELGEL